MENFKLRKEGKKMSSEITKITGYAFYISKYRNSTETFPRYDNTLFPYTLEFLNKEMAQDIMREFNLYDDPVNGNPEDEDYKNEVNNIRFMIEQGKTDKFQTYFEMIKELELTYGINLIKSEIPIKIPYESQRRIAEKFLYTKAEETERVRELLKNKSISIADLTMAVHDEVYAQVTSYMFVYDKRILSKGIFEEELNKKIDKNNKSPLYIIGVAEVTIAD